MEFASPFDEALARQGPPAVFLQDRHGKWRLQGEWTRTAYQEAPGPHARSTTWTLLRDRASGFVVTALVTSPTLLRSHPRMDVRVVDDLEAARAVCAAIGHPPIDRSPWEEAP